MTPRGADRAEVYRITEARPPHSDDLDQRMARYLISMAVRTACVILVFVVPGPLRWVFAAGAVVLPYIAVVFANASGRRRSTPNTGPPSRPELAAAPPAGTVPQAGPPAADPATEPATEPAGPRDPVVLTGIVETPGHDREPGS